MWKITARWINTATDTAQHKRWDPAVEPSFTTFLMDISPNPEKTLEDLMFLTARVSNVNTLVDDNDPLVAWITEMNVANTATKDEVVNYYTSVIAANYASIGSVTVTAEEV